MIIELLTYLQACAVNGSARASGASVRLEVTISIGGTTGFGRSTTAAAAEPARGSSPPTAGGCESPRSASIVRALLAYELALVPRFPMMKRNAIGLVHDGSPSW